MLSKLIEQTLPDVNTQVHLIKMRTTSTFIKETDEFEIHTQDFEAAKTWVGNLGETATHASVFAQLITENGKK